ncbi:D-alanyl-D-alanine dipeptidase [Amycolatopsis antarctica]|uniref:D-alanyl-D-alanine dipeptidase n=1 Tax=Amycolatopsis antarctica TaxID=1854586 RepID=A0A263DAW7_9PSEU|nr:M15 family metallopeptidase [Amycolatopsis antarctica]OZM74636.1 D-alanyl-D-alanine dipeptidase [Amycolatopsis antarctica]
MRFPVSRIGALTAALLVLASPLAAATDEPTAPPEFVALSDVDSTILQEIRYTGEHDFVGRPVNGYLEPMCIITRPAAEALRTAQQQLLPRGYTLKVYDCFRPQRSVDDFVAWAEDPDDTEMKAEFYPDIDKSRLFEEGYIAEKSGHSRGSTVDLTLVRTPPAPQPDFVPGQPLTACTAPAGERFPDNMVDMGTGYDCFDTLSNTDDPRVTGEQRANRDLLRDAMKAQGFDGIETEWWHFTFAGEPFPDTYFDFPVARSSLTPADACPSR